MNLEATPSAKTASTDTTLYNQKNNPAAKKYLYNTKEYGFIGFFLTLIPVFIMSFHNSGILPNGETVKKRMSIYLKIYIVGFVSYLGFIAWAIYDAGTRFKEAVLADPDMALQLLSAPSLDEAVGSKMESLSLSYTLLDNSEKIFTAFNLILLIIVIKYLNKTELLAFQELKEKGQVEIKRFAYPILIGIGLSLVVYFAINWFSRIIINSIFNS